MKAFLSAAGWADAAATPLVSDASARRYTRLSKQGRSAMLMLDPDGDTARFARLARHLTAQGLSAPQILAEDHAKGLLLIEDLGDGLLARLATTAETEQRLYLLATDALVALHSAPPPPDLPVATPDTLAAMTDLAFTEYAQDSRAYRDTQAALDRLLRAHAGPPDVMILRDYHAENILELPDRSGAARAGLLDFQDAMLGHRAYDLVSLLRDARRDVQPGTAAACIAHFAQRTGTAEADLKAAMAVLGLQRNLRILGVFARLARLGKPRYLAWLPRVWDHVQSDLGHPALSPLRPTLAALPAPEPAHIARLRAT